MKINFMETKRLEAAFYWQNSKDLSVYILFSAANIHSVLRIAHSDYNRIYI